MKRREFIALLGGGAAAWPLAAHAQQGGRMRRIGVLTAGAENLPVTQAVVTAWREGLQKVGWTEGRNIRIDYRFAAADPDRLRAYAAELVGLTPDAIVASGAPPLAALQTATRTIPIVFANVTDPVANGFVTSVARPGGNITGFATYEQSISLKWLELLKEIAPRVTRVAFLHDPLNPITSGYWREIERGAPAFGVQASAAPVASAAEIERALAEFAREPNSGLVVAGGPAMTVNSALIIALAARYRLPAVYAFRNFVVAGGLAFYGTNEMDLYRGAATYVDRILKGDKPGDLPVQFATKFELVINLKTAKELGLDPPITLLARTDEVIE